MEKEKAIEVLTALSEGLDPFSGEVFSEDSPYQNSQTVRALQKALEVMKGVKKLKKEKMASSELPIELSLEQEVFYNEMRAWRNQAAERMNIKPYLIMNNMTLREIIKNGVKNKEELISVRGMGDAKVGKYGDAIIKALKEIGTTQSTYDGEQKEAM